MSADATAEFRAALAAFELQPDAIQWSGKIERFRGPGDRGSKKSGWYIAHAATGEIPAIAKFGHWGRLPTQTFVHKNGRADDYDPEIANKAIAELEAKRAEQRRVKQDAAAKKAQEMWERAGEASIEHPYLQKKGITDARGLKQMDDKLLIPMRGMGPGSPILSLQLVDGDGEKRFLTDGQVSGTRTSIGVTAAFKGEGTLYLCEGWATGWSVHQATKAPVVVAFSTGNLESVATALREKYPALRIIIAADNDRWTEAWFEGAKTPNPGLVFGTHAAKKVRALLALPDFDDLTSKPTDFNDLHRLAGLDAVRAQLSTVVDPTTGQREAPPAPTPPAAEKTPHNALRAAPPEPPTAKEPPKQPPEKDAWVDSAPFRAIGYDHGVYYYLPRYTGQIHALSSSQHRREPLLEMADVSWWELHFPSARGAASWPSAAQAMMRACQRVGVFRPARLRGRGCWPFEMADGSQSCLLHLGDRLLPPEAKQYVDPESFVDPEGRIYEKRQRLKGPSEKRGLDLRDTDKLIDLFRDLMWFEEASGPLLAGWTVLAPLCGALKWRPHVWITGDAGCGKTTLVNDLVVPLTGGMSLQFESSATTEPGIRQELHSDAVPVILDEAEKQDLRSDDRIQSILTLMRSASSSGEARVAKGSTHGQATTFQVRSMFCLASIGGSLRHEADKTRVSMLQLHGAASKTKAERAAHWERYRPKLNLVDDQVGRELVARTLGWLRDGRLIETIDTFRSAAAIVLGNQRWGDQYGTLFAGAWTLMSDNVPTEEDAREIISTAKIGHYMQEQMPAGKKALTTLLQRRERLDGDKGSITVTVGQMIDACLDRPAPISDAQAEAFLKQVGMRVEFEAGQMMLLVANQSDWIREALKNTPYGDGLCNVLRTLPGALTGKTVRFHAGLVCRTTAVPIAALDAREEDEDPPASA